MLRDIGFPVRNNLMLVAATAAAITVTDNDNDCHYVENESDVDVYTQIKAHVIYMKIYRLLLLLLLLEMLAKKADYSANNARTHMYMVYISYAYVADCWRQRRRRRKFTNNFSILSYYLL